MSHNRNKKTSENKKHKSIFQQKQLLPGGETPDNLALFLSTMGNEKITQLLEGAVLQAKADENSSHETDKIETTHNQESTYKLPDYLRERLEQISGFDLNDVTVHKNSNNPAQLGAHAYAQGSDIYLAPGQEKHLSHEAWHVVQQKQGRVKATDSQQGIAMNNNPALEKEADEMGSLAKGKQPVENPPVGPENESTTPPVIQKQEFNDYAPWNYQPQSIEGQETNSDYYIDHENQQSVLRPEWEREMLKPEYLQQGCKGYEVKKLQEKLIALGYLKGKADGDFGKMTAMAVMDFQQDNFLVPDGIAGKQTQAQLTEAISGNYKKSGTDDKTSISTIEALIDEHYKKPDKKDKKKGSAADRLRKELSRFIAANKDDKYLHSKWMQFLGRAQDDDLRIVITNVFLSARTEVLILNYAATGNELVYSRLKKNFQSKSKTPEMKQWFLNKTAEASGGYKENLTALINSCFFIKEQDGVCEEAEDWEKPPELAEEYGEVIIEQTREKYLTGQISGFAVTDSAGAHLKLEELNFSQGTSSLSWEEWNERTSARIKKAEESIAKIDEKLKKANKKKEGFENKRAVINGEIEALEAKDKLTKKEQSVLKKKRNKRKDYEKNLTFCNNEIEKLNSEKAMWQQAFDEKPPAATSNASTVIVDLNKSGVNVKWRAGAAQGPKDWNLDPVFALCMIGFLKEIKGLGVKTMYNMGFLRAPLSPRDTHPQGKACDICGFEIGGKVLALRRGKNMKPDEKKYETDHSDLYVNYKFIGDKPYAQILLDIEQIMLKHFTVITGPRGDAAKHSDHWHVQTTVKKNA